MNYKVLFRLKKANNVLLEKEFETYKMAKSALSDIRVALSDISRYALMLHECSFETDYSNTGVILKKISEWMWIEIENDET
jgi:hypothetical protein